MSERFLGSHTIYGVDGEHRTPYMTRIWIGRLRLHIFHRGDADPDPHDHPWDFWTFPLTAYVEAVTTKRLAEPGTFDPYLPRPLVFRTALQVVQSFRWSFRPAEHTHRVIGRYRGWDRGVAGVPGLIHEPIAESGRIVTLVWRGRARRKWGFLKNRDGQWCWIGWRDYIFGGGKNAPCGPEDAP